MNRRSFIFGGGIVAVAGAVATVIIKASQPNDSVSLCKDLHEPLEIYKKQVAIAISNTDDPVRTIVPCAKCGVLFALTVKNPANVGIKR